MRFEKAMIPDDVTTFEQLVAWAGANLSFNGYTLNYQERQPSVPIGDQGIQAVFEQQGPFRAHDNSPRMLYRFALEMVPDYGSVNYAMSYQAVKEAINSEANVDFLNEAYRNQ
ncbi:MAG: hypothetical protein AAFQ63_09095 [Cyanobacteria bacterium J06621_11]